MNALAATRSSESKSFFSEYFGRSSLKFISRHPCSVGYGSLGGLRLDRKLRMVLLVTSVTLLFLIVTDTGRRDYYLVGPTRTVPTDTSVNMVIDPAVVAAVSSEKTQHVSLRMTHELSDAEIRYLEDSGVLFRRRGGRIVHAGTIYLAEVTSLAAVEVLTGTAYLEQLDADSSLNEIQLDQSIGNISADLTYALRDPIFESQNITGAGVTVAIIDTGIDWQHPDFYFADGGEYYYRSDTVEGSYIDLDDDSTYDVGEKAYYYNLTGDGGMASQFDPAYDWLISDTNDNEAYDYGIDYAYLANDVNGNGILEVGETCIRLNTCKISKIWDQTTDDFYIRGTNLTNPSINTHVDTNGHGTHVAGTVAGGQLGYRTFTGVAPDAEIMMVETTFYSSDIMDAVIWAVNEGADVISMSIGGYIHRPLDGSTNFEQVFDWAHDQGVPCAISAGNSANDQIHSSLPLLASTETLIEFEVTSSSQSNVYLTTLWRTPSNSLSLRMQAPYTDEAGPILSIPLNGTQVYVDNNIVSAYRYTSLRDTAYINIRITYQSPRTEVETGIWHLYLNNPAETSETVHNYVYPSGHNKMLNYVTASHTVSSPATADNVIAVASYVTKLGGSSGTLYNRSVFSSIGPRIDGQLKPEVSAPGEVIMSAYSKDAGGAPGSHQLLQGTSMACPHVSGVLALAVQCHPVGMPFNASSLRNDVLLSADQDSYTGSVPNALWGYGKLDAFETVVREFPDVGPIILEVTVNDVLVADYHSTEVVRGESFVLSVLVADDQSPHDLSVIMEYGEAGGMADGNSSLVYDRGSGRWNISLSTTAVTELITFNFTFVAYDPLFSSDPHTIFVDVLNELPLIHATHVNATAVLRTDGIEFAVNASDYHDDSNLQVLLCLQRPDSSWVNTTMPWNGTLFVRSVLFNSSDQLGQWNVYVQVADQDGGVVTEVRDAITLSNNDPSVTGNMVSTEVSVGEYLEVEVISDDVEDSWSGLTVEVCLKDSLDNWYNYTVAISGGFDTVQINTSGLYLGSYEVYVIVADQDGGRAEAYCGTLLLVDTTPPTVDSPSDIEYDELSTGHLITWSPDDLHPQDYVVYLDGVLIKSGPWNSSSECIMISVDGHGLGVYNYTLVVTDIGANTASDTVFVTVSDGTEPTVDSPSDIEYNEFSTGHSITWCPADHHPDSYRVYTNGTLLKSGIWNSSSETITISVDDLGLGTYNYTIFVFDVGSNIASDDVLVIVVDGTPPTVNSPPDVEYIQGETANHIEWRPYDLHPWFCEIFRDGETIWSASWEDASEPISISVDGLEVGVYNYTIIVTDVGGNTVSDIVMVTVSEPTTTATTTSTTTTTTTTTPTTTSPPPEPLSPMMIVLMGAGIGVVAIVAIIIVMRRQEGSG